MKTIVKKLTSSDVELAVVKYLGVRTYTIVPNVSWSMFNYEMDLFVLTKYGYGWEIEIRVDPYDLKRDKLKNHNHASSKIKYLYFAIPDYLLRYSEHIPAEAGIITVDKNGKCDTVRDPIEKNNYKFSCEERVNILRLSSIRVWNLKKIIKDNARDYIELVKKVKILNKKLGIAT